MMMRRKIDSSNFEKSFSKLLEIKKGEKVIKGRFDLEPIELEARLDFIIQLLLSFKSVVGLTYKILFWEKNNFLQSFFEFNQKKYSIVTPYQNGELPGVIFLDEDVLDQSFIKSLLIIHFNYEMAKDPSLNLRVQLCVNHEKYITLLDIYDDRGFDIYYLK